MPGRWDTIGSGPAHSRLPAGWWRGCSTAEVHQQAREAWGVSHRTADRLVAAARAELVRGWDVQSLEMIAFLLARLDTVFREAMEAKNHGAALGWVRSTAPPSWPSCDPRPGRCSD